MTLPEGATGSTQRMMRWAGLLLAAPLCLACGSPDEISGSETGEESETETGEGETSPDVEEEPPPPSEPIPGPAATGCSLQQVWRGRGPSEFTEDGSLANDWHYALDEDGGFTVLAYTFVGGLDGFFITRFNADTSERWQRVADLSPQYRARGLRRLANDRLVIFGGELYSLSDSTSGMLEWFSPEGDNLGTVLTSGQVWTGAYARANGQLLLAGEQSLSWSDPNGYVWASVNPGNLEPDVGTGGAGTNNFIKAMIADPARTWVVGTADQVVGGWLAELDGLGEVVWEVTNDQLGPRFELLVPHEEGLLVAGPIWQEPGSEDRSWLAVYSTEGELLSQHADEGELLPHIEELEALPSGGYIARAGRELLRLSPQLEVEHSCRLDGPNEGWEGSFGQLELAGEQVFVAVNGDPLTLGTGELRALMRVEGMLD